MIKSKTLIILDWDDTLFPTSWIMKNSININDSVMKNDYVLFFSKLDKIISDLLTKCLKRAKVVVVTNAMVKWVISSSNVLPKTQRIIMKKVAIISARDMYQNKLPGQMGKWKKLIFEQLVFDYFDKHLLYTVTVENIISIGDAEYEFKALTDLYDHLNVRYNNVKKHTKYIKHKKHNKKRLLKSIRFMQSPTYDSLLDQLEVLSNCINQICSSSKHMDLKFKSKT